MLGNYSNDLGETQIELHFLWYIFTMTALPTLDRAFGDEETTALLESYQLPSFDPSDELLNHATAMCLADLLVGADCWGAAIDEKVMFNGYDESRSIDEIVGQDVVRNHFLTYHNIVWYVLRNHCGGCEIYMYGAVTQAWKAVLELVDRSDPHNPKWKVKFFGNYPL